MTYTVDRMEEGLAVLQDEQEQIHTVPLTKLPSSVRPGDVLLFENGAYTVDVEETRARRERILQLQNRLRKREI